MAIKTTEKHRPVRKARGARKAAPTRAKQRAHTVMAWQDDPASALPPVSLEVAQLSQGPLKFRVKDGAVQPGDYQPGTPGFRFWSAAEALRRGADFFTTLGLERWQLGATLPVGLDEGVDLNAYYDRTELAFFHDLAGGKTIYSGESPDVVCHEMGHACLDSHRPELWDAPFIETGGFHEAFGDMSAILSALRLRSVREASLAALAANKSSDLSRMAEQLGWAIRQERPTSVDRDCLRDACNSFHYQDPQTLPHSAPATELSTEVHSFSRVFTGAFYEILGGMLKARSSNPTQATLDTVATDCGRLLLAAVAAAPIQPNYFAQVASHMIDADTSLFDGRYRKVLTAVFVKRRFIPAAAVASLLGVRGRDRRGMASIAAHTLEAPIQEEKHDVVLAGATLGLPDRPIIVAAPVERKPLVAVSAAMLEHRVIAGTSELERATRRFVEMLVAHDRVESAPRPRARGMAGEQPRSLRRTHVLEETPEGLRLVRQRFD